MNDRYGGLPLLPELLRFCVSATILQRNSATTDPGAKYVWPQALLNCTTLPEITAWLLKGALLVNSTPKPFCSRAWARVSRGADRSTRRTLSCARATAAPPHPARKRHLVPLSRTSCETWRRAPSRPEWTRRGERYTVQKTGRNSFSYKHLFSLE